MDIEKSKLCSILILLLFWGVSFGQGSLLLVGGGGEDSLTWSDEPYGWFVQQADSGIIINIDVDPVASFYPDYFRFLGADPGCFALRIANRTAANDSNTYKQLITARGIFIEGGDQWDYVSTWKGTLVEDAIHYIFQNGGAIGGTSAGLAVLGEIVFDAEFGSSYPEDAAYNPYHPDISLTDDFLQILPNVLTDSHFHERGRIGRLVPMMARRIQDSGQENIIGIGISPQSAMCIDSNLIGTVYGKTSATILYKTEKSFINCQPNVPLTFTNIGFDQLVHGAIYDLNTKTLIDPGPYLTAAGELPDIPVFADTVIVGSSAASARLGEVEFTNLTTDSDNARDGSLVYLRGDSIIPKTIIVPQLWNDPAYYENRLVAGIFALAGNHHYTTLYLDDNCTDTITSDGILTTGTLTYIIDAYGTTHFGVNRSVRTNYAGVIGAELHFLGPGQQYDLKAHNSVTQINKKTPVFPRKPVLYQNYPNPFNSQTAFRYVLLTGGFVKLEVSNMLGKKLDTLVSTYQGPGTYKVLWNASEYSSGIYFFSLYFDQTKMSKKALLLK